jgi:hypothetical protein
MSENQTPAELLGQVRDFVRELLDEEAAPPQITFCLAYVATELGLAMTDNSARVVPVVLDAVAHATRVMTQQEEGDEEEPSEGDEAPALPRGVPKLTIVH